MEMFNPPSPGEIIVEIFLRLLNISHANCAEQLGLPLNVFKRLLCGASCRKLANTRQFLA